MKTPKFWKSINVFSILLLPLSLLYFVFYKLRCLININPYRSKIPVICIGNLTAGGSGKTPLAVELAKVLKNKHFCFLTKGYGGNFKNVLKVSENSSADEVGDEALILRDYGDVFVSKSRVDGLKYINEISIKNNNFNYDYIIVDDGLQNPTFVKDKIFLVINGNFGFGNGLFLPAGALRDKLKNIYQKVDLVVINGDDEKNISKVCEKYKINYTKAKITAITYNIDLTKEYVAFCGLGLPEKFRKTLYENGIKVKNFVVFEDHHKYTNKDMENLRNISKDLKLITTRKDFVKLSDEYKKNVCCLDIFLEIEDKSLLEEL